MRVDLVRAVVVVAASLGLVGASIAGCGTKSDHPPELSSPNAYSIDNPVECSELYAASDEVRSQIPGPLTYDGGAAECLVKGTECPLADVDGGLCDGGSAVALPGARCVDNQWTGVCFPRDAGAVDAPTDG